MHAQKWPATCLSSDTRIEFNECEGRNSTQAGDKVRFLVSDVFLTGPEGVLPPPSASEELEGTIVDFSDSGHRSQFFALVDVIRKQTVVVPVEKLHRIPGPDTGS